MNIKKYSKKTWDTIFKVFDSIFSISSLPFAMYALFTEEDNPQKIRYACAAFFTAFCLSYICQALRKRNRGDAYIWQMIQSGVYVVSIILILAVPSSDTSMPIITVLFMVMMIASRIQSIMKKRTYRNIIFNISLIILIIAAAFLGSFAFVCLYMLALNLAHIVSLSFSGMDMKILIRVIHKTYAADILSGLILFMAAFSFVFPILEEEIPTFRDALWYSFAVVTTIGFGDYSAVTTLGRIMSAILGAYGIVVVALITSVVVNFYSEVKALPDEEEVFEETQEDGTGEAKEDVIEEAKEDVKEETKEDVKEADEEK